MSLYKFNFLHLVQRQPSFPKNLTLKSASALQHGLMFRFLSII